MMYISPAAAANDGSKQLNVDQKAKIESIPDMQQELKEFEDKLKELTA